MAGSTEPFTDGSIITAAGQNEANWRGYTITGLNHLRQLIDRAGVYSAGQIDGWGEAYIDSNGRNNSVGTGDTTALFDTNKYKFFNESVYVIIEATSLNVNEFNPGDYQIYEYETGKWVLWYASGTDELKRAKLYSLLFNGTSARASSTYITGLTALRTSVTRDVGKQAYYFTIYTSAYDDVDGYFSGTFSDTTTNTDCSSWSNLRTDNNTAGNGGGTSTATFELPTGTTLNNANQTGDADISSNEIGTDNSADETDNPSNFKLRVASYHTGVNYLYATAIILCKGTLSSSFTNVTGSLTNSTIDFNVDNSIPVFTSIATSFDNLVPFIVEHTIPTGTFPSTISSVIGVPFIEDWETGADIQYKLTNATEDTGWLDTMNTSPEVSSFTAFTSEPTTLIVKLVPKTTSPTAGYPSVRGFFINAWSD